VLDLAMAQRKHSQSVYIMFWIACMAQTDQNVSAQFRYGGGLPMRTALIRTLILIIAFIGTEGFAQDLDREAVEQAEKAFSKADERWDLGKYDEALDLYKKGLEVIPNDPVVLYNAGFAAYKCQDYAQAIDLWKRCKKINPSDWQVRVKLIQAYQALLKIKNRDAERTALIEMWKSGENADLKKQFSYCRDQFEVNGKKVMVREYFELAGEHASRYEFEVLDEAGERFTIYLSASDETGNENMRESGNKRFHLDRNLKNGHVTYAVYSSEPPYDEIRTKVIKILKGKTKVTSSAENQKNP
jgi:tetratricopeptide (TPR) repeat protein